MRQSTPRSGRDSRHSSVRSVGLGTRRASLLRVVTQIAGPSLLASAPGALAHADDDLPITPPTLAAPMLRPGDAIPPPAPVAAAAPAALATTTNPEPVGAVPSGRETPTITPTTPPPTRPMAVLAIPGLARPGSASRPTPPAATPSSEPELVAPRATSEPLPVGTNEEVLPPALGDDLGAGRVIVSRPGASERADELTLDVPTAGARETPEPAADPFPLRTPPSTNNNHSTPRIEPTPRDSAPATPGRRRLFGLLPPAPSTARSAPAASLRAANERNAPADSDRDDPEAAARETLRRRIEKQARLYAGDRARSVEVRLDGKHATVRASGVRFYQKRTVRKALESLPALAGLRSTIEVLD